MIKIVKSKECLPNEFSWGSLTWYASGAVGNALHMTTGLCKINAGQENPRHHHPNCEEILHVLQGTISHILGDESIEMTVGDTICIPQNIDHHAKNIGKDEARLYISFSSSDRKTVNE